MVNWCYAKFSDLASTAASQQGVLTFEQLRAGGRSESQIKYLVKTGQLARRPGRVFVIAGSVPTWHQNVASAAFGAARHVREADGAVGAASHHSAARLFAMRSFDSEVAVSVRYPRRIVVPGARVVRSRDLELGDVTWVDGIPTTTPERTIVDLGLDFPEHEVMRILRHSVAVGQVNRSDVRRMRERTRKQGRDGTGVVDRCLDALPELAEHAESGSEVLFLQMCEVHGLPAPVPQLPVMANGKSYRLDFAYPVERVFVEIDGAPHDAPIRIAKDGGRQNDLVAHGWLPIRLHYRQLVLEPDYCAHLVRQLLATARQSVGDRFEPPHQKPG